jgi:hypothetical protein
MCFLLSELVFKWLDGKETWCCCPVHFVAIVNGSMQRILVLFLCVLLLEFISVFMCCVVGVYL